MPRKSRAEIEASIAELQAELDTAETDDEIWIKHPDGHEVKVTGRKASNVLKKFGGIFDDDADDQSEGDDQEESDEQPGGGDGGYFRGRKR